MPKIGDCMTCYKFITYTLLLYMFTKLNKFVIQFLSIIKGRRN